MAIASSTPSFFRIPGLSMVLAPVQALAAFFMPLASGQAQCRHQASSYQQRPSSAQSRMAGRTAGSTPESTKNHPLSRLKVIREFEQGTSRSQTGRMVISGRMADVCAELDRIAQKESTRR